MSNRKNPIFPAKGSLVDVFNAFSAQGATPSLITRKKTPYSWGYGSVVGKIKNGDAAIFIPDGGTTGSEADTVIAEIFHLAGTDNYSDEQLAKAVYHSRYASDAASVIAPQANIFDNQHYQARGWKEHQAYSVYFHYIQMLHCTAVPQPLGHPRQIR